MKARPRSPVLFGLLFSWNLLYAGPPSGEVVGWGVNVAGEATGLPSFAVSNGAVVIGNNPYATGIVTTAGQVLTDVAGISAGSGFSLALKKDGTVVGWGDNQMGRATGTYTSDPYRTNGPVRIANHIVTNIVSIAAGGSFSLALKADGTVTCWGKHPAQANGVVSFSLLSEEEQTNALYTKINQDAVDPAIGAIIRRDPIMVPRYPEDQMDSVRNGVKIGFEPNGTVTTWVRNDTPMALSNVVAIAARGFFSVALKRDGTVLSWGSEPWCQTDVPAGLSNVVAVTSGGGQYERSMALKSDGTVVAWKSSMPHEIGVPAGLSNVVAIAAGVVFSLALKQDGTVFEWGFNQNGEATGIPAQRPPYESSGLVTIGGQVLTNVTAIAAGDQYCLALKKDGRVVAWGNHRFYKDVPADLTNVVAIAAGDGFCLAIKKQ